MKNCELCNGLARIYCESDHANLCWDCDMKVHSANFLVAKHSRSLLCHVCQSPTAWSATGTKIGRTVSVCERCSNNNNNTPSIIPQVIIREGRVYVDIIPTLAGGDEIDGEEDERIDDIEQEEEEIDLEDIQVVPWSSTPPPPRPSSSDEESLNSYGSFSLKRMREDDDDSGTSTSHREVDAPPEEEARGGDEGAAIVDSFSTRMRTPSKIQRTEERLTGRVGLKLKRSSVVKV